MEDQNQEGDKMKYRYIGNGIVAVHIDDKRYELGYNHARLKDTIEISRKLKEDELALIGCLELVDESKKRKTNKGDN